MSSDTVETLGVVVALETAINQLKTDHAACDRVHCPWSAMTEEDIEDLAHAVIGAGYSVVDRVTGSLVRH